MSASTLLGSVVTQSSRVLRRILEGRTVWGEFIVAPSRNGVTRYELRLYPPGTNAAERVQRRVWRAWPVACAVVWIVGMAVFTSFEPVLQACAISTVLSAVSTAGVGTFTRRRCPTRRLAGVVIQERPSVTRLGRCDEILDALVRLEDADGALQSGAISAADHERLWAAVWEGVETPRAFDRRAHRRRVR